MNIEPLILTSRDIKLLEDRNLEIGRGTDGIVYKTGNLHEKNNLYKIYFNSLDVLSLDLKNLNSEETKIANDKSIFRSQISSACYKIKYIDVNGIRLGGMGSFYKAIERQKNIKRTKLQKKPIYVDGHFRGVVLHYHKRQLPIGYLKCFPFNVQVNTLKELLISLEELLENYIYHIDLGLKSDDDYKSANVLLSWFPYIYPNIIDIDGKSAIYTENYNKEYYYKSLRTYKNLVVQLLFDIDPERIEFDDIEYLEEKLIKIGLKSDFIYPLLNVEETLDVKCMYEFLDDIKKINSKQKIKIL